MKYILQNVSDYDKLQIYSIKKSSIMPYVKNIWGWDEEYQINDFNKSFVPQNFKKIIVNKTCIGFIEILEKEKVINITEIHIIPEYQGLGIGSSIIKNIITYGKEKNKTITLGCFKDNISAIKLYNRLGFKVINETETHFCYELK